LSGLGECDRPSAAAAAARAALNADGQNTSTVRQRRPGRVIITVNGTSRFSYVTQPAAAAAAGPGEVFSLLPKRFMTSSKRQVVRMSVSVIVGFVACWLPYFVVSLVRIFSDYRYKLSAAAAVTKLMTVCHSALNPLLYLIFLGTGTRK